MMSRFTPKALFITGGALLLIGFLVPFLMVLGVIPLWLWLEMVTALIQIVGLAMGIMGSVMYVKSKRDEKDRY